MTQLTNSNEHFSNSNNSSFGYPSHYIQQEYFVQEPLGKRPFPPEFDLDMEYAPRAKRRFEKISTCLSHFSISNDSPQQIPQDSSSEDDEMEYAAASTSDVCNGSELPVSSSSSAASSPEPVVNEPDDEPAMVKKIKLDDSLQKYLQNARENSVLLPRKERLKGNEVTLWRPSLLISPKNEINMEGRIIEIDDEEEQRVVQEIKQRIIETDGMLDEQPLDFTASNDYIIEHESSDGGNSDIGSSWNSPAPSPPSSHIVEIGEETRAFTPSSLTNGSVSDEEMMEFDD